MHPRTPARTTAKLRTNRVRCSADQAAAAKMPGHERGGERPGIRPWGTLGRRKMARRDDRDHATGGGGHSFHAVRPDAFNYVWDNSIEPELEIDSGEVVEFGVRDASDEQLRADSTSEDFARLDFDHVNPVSGPVAGFAARAALLGGYRAVDRHHGPGRRHGPQRHAAGQLGGAGGPARVRLRLRGHPVCLLRLHPTYELLQPCRVRLRPLRGDARTPRRLLLGLGPPWHLPCLHRRLHRRGGTLRAGLLRQYGHLAQRRVASDLAGGSRAHLVRGVRVATRALLGMEGLTVTL